MTDNGRGPAAALAIPRLLSVARLPRATITDLSISAGHFQQRMPAGKASSTRQRISTLQSLRGVVTLQV